MRLAGGCTVGFDDVGDPEGLPVVYLHGTPDSRVARHPDDALATDAGIRLLAVDRPGYGGTSPLAPGRSGGFADDLVALLDHVGVESAALLAWSGGALDGVAAAADPRLAGRLRGVHAVAGLVPREAYDDAEVRDAGQHRLGLIEMAEGLPPAELAEAVAPMLAPWPCDHVLALEHQAEHREPADQAALKEIPGAIERLADGLVEAVRSGLAGVEADLAAQLRPGVVDPGAVTVPVHLWYGTDDLVTPPAFGEWYARHLGDARLHLIDGAGHYLPVTHWPTLLTALCT